MDIIARIVSQNIWWGQEKVYIGWLWTSRGDGREGPNAPLPKLLGQLGKLFVFTQAYNNNMIYNQIKIVLSTTW